MKTKKSTGVADGHQPPPMATDSLDLINFHVAIFGIFLSLSFAYFVYFSYQLTEIQSDMVSKIYEINAINMPYPLQFLTITGHKDYGYIQRRDSLRQEFNSMERRLEAPILSDAELVEIGTSIQRTITQIAYFFPYKRMLEFNKDGSVNFDPNKQDSIDINKPVDTNFLKQQVDEIYNWNYTFTLKLKDSKERIANTMALAGNIKDEYTKSRVTKYLDSLIGYLDRHYELAVPLGLTMKRYDYMQGKLGKWDLMLVTSLLILNFSSGVLFPLFWTVTGRKKWLEIIFQGSFILGCIFLFKEALYSVSY